VSDRSLSLYEIVSDLESLLDALDSPEGLDEEAGDMLDRYLEHELPAKAEGYCGVIASLNAHAEACKIERHRMHEREKKALHVAATMKRRLLDAMDRLGVPRLQTTRFTVTAVDRPPRVVIDDDAALPPQVTEIRQTTHVDKQAIKALLQLNEEVPGAHLERGRTVRIK